MRRDDDMIETSRPPDHSTFTPSASRVTRRTPGVQQKAIRYRRDELFHIFAAAANDRTPDRPARDLEQAMVLANRVKACAG